MNPHGTCKTCVWHTCDPFTDSDGCSFSTWWCWKNCGEPETRLVTSSDRQPPGCESHLKAEKR